MSNLVTVIQFASLVGKAPQQIYNSIKNGAFPKELIEYKAAPSGRQQPMIDQDAAVAWFKEKEGARLAKASVSLVYTAEKLIQDLEEAGKKGLATQVKNFIANKVN